MKLVDRTHTSRRPGFLRRGGRLLAIVAITAATLPAALFGAATASANSPVTGAAFTTTNQDVDGSGHCLNGNEAINCNIYTGKQYVWLNGGPSVAYVGDGDYFFAVLSPGGQATPNDGGTNVANGDLANLSDDFDTYTNRTFSVSGGTVTYGGSHDFANNKIRLLPYADTPNPGGVYIMAICSLADGYPVAPSKCKYDAFKVTEATTPQAFPPTIVKDAAGSFDTTWNWTITKDVDKTLVKQVGGTATFTYTVKVRHDRGTDSNIHVVGTITVFNPNEDSITDADVTDTLSNGVVCTVTGGADVTLPKGETDFAYSCDLTAVPISSVLNNVATVTWPQQTLTDGNLDAGFATFEFEDIAFTQTKIDDCVAVTDTFNGTTTTLGTVCKDASNPTTFTYSRTVPVPAFDCVSYTNTATFTTNTTGTTGSASQTVTVCGPAKTGALTMGFWQNPNGQSIISTGPSTSGVCNSGTWLRQYAPYQDLSATAKCSAVASYVYKVIKVAKCTNSTSTCNSMLKAQMLATALDVYFSDPALGGNKIAAPHPLGAVSIDLTKVCKMIDASGGTATCPGTFESVSSAFGGATALTVSQMLAYAASQSNVGGTAWYGQVKATQVLAKDAFDAINNQVAFSA
jgi:hypothetical protein